MGELSEAVTIKARAKALLEAIRELLGSKNLPKTLHGHLESVQTELKKSWADLETDRGDGKEATEAAKVTKSEGDAGNFPASDYAYVPDPEKPSTWKLRLTATPGGEPDSAMVGAAVAALGKGFRGQKVDIPEADLPAVKRKVRAAWKKANPNKGADDMPEAIKESGDFSHDDVRRMLQQAVSAGQGSGGAMVKSLPWVRDVYDDWFVYSDDTDGKTYKRSYVIDDKGNVTMGDPQEVVMQTVYVPVGESATIESECIPLIERAVRTDGTIKVKLIQPGWGSSGYYPAKVLERDGPVAFPKGTHMYWNHPTETEARERPERDLRDLAAVLQTDAQFEAHNPAGPGLYGEAKVMGPYKEAVEELAPYIGTSIRAWGQAKDGEADGRQGKIIEKITLGRSCDFVTVPGAGGQVLQLFESARHGAAINHTEEKTVDEKEAQALREANRDLMTKLQAANEAQNGLAAENAHLKERLLLRDAHDLVVATLAGKDMPEPTRARLIEALATKPVLKDGQLDKDATKAAVEAAAQAEMEYLARVTGAGQIKGLGASGPDPKVSLKESFKRMYLAQGHSPDEADKLAALAADGR